MGLFKSGLQFILILGAGFFAKVGSHGQGERIHVFIKPLSFLFPESVCIKIDVDIKSGDGSAEHLPVFAVDRTPPCIQFDEALMKTVAHAAPVFTLHPLDIEGSSEYQ